MKNHNFQKNENDDEINNVNHSNEEDTVAPFNYKNKYESNYNNRREIKEDSLKINDTKKVNENSQMSTSVKTIPIPNILEQHNNIISSDEIKYIIKNNNLIINDNKKSLKDNNENILDKNIKDNNEHFNIYNDIDGELVSNVSEESNNIKREEAIKKNEERTDELKYIKGFNIFGDPEILSNLSNNIILEEYINNSKFSKRKRRRLYKSKENNI